MIDIYKKAVYKRESVGISKTVNSLRSFIFMIANHCAYTETFHIVMQTSSQCKVCTQKTFYKTEPEPEKKTS